MFVGELFQEFLSGILSQLFTPSTKAKTYQLVRSCCYNTLAPTATLPVLMSYLQHVIHNHLCNCFSWRVIVSPSSIVFTFTFPSFPLISYHLASKTCLSLRARRKILLFFLFLYDRGFRVLLQWPLSLSTEIIILNAPIDSEKQS